MNRLRLTFTGLLPVLLLLTACDSTEPDSHMDGGEEELITRITLTLSGGGDTVTASANDPDGDGVGFQIEPLVLRSGVSYSGTIEVADDINDADITDEIRDEADVHQFFFTTGGANAGRLNVAATDADENGLPIGLEFNITVSPGGSGSASLNVVLSHYERPVKNGTTRSDETDIDVTFPVTIQ